MCDPPQNKTKNVRSATKNEDEQVRVMYVRSTTKKENKQVRVLYA